MDKACRLRVVAWMYVLIGMYALVQQVVSLFTPVNMPFLLLPGLPRVNIAVLMLPIGIGLMRRSNLSRGLALTVSWLAITFFVGILAFIELVALSGGEITRTPPEGPVDGDAISAFIGFLVIGVPVFAWQLRELHSRAARSLTEARSDEGRDSSLV